MRAAILSLMVVMCMSQVLVSDGDLPEKYDVREAYPECVKPAMNNGFETDWATGPVSVLEHQYCIEYGVQVDLSINHLKSCVINNKRPL